MRRIATTAVVAGIALSLGVVAGAAGASTPARDTFSGTLASGSGAYQHTRAQLTMKLNAPGSAGSQRKLTITVTSSSCRGCSRISGTLRGTLSAAQRTNPDVGGSYKMAVSGTLTGLGKVSASGTIHGTGYIERGRETLAATLRNAHGSVTVQAQSPQVPGFTSP